MKKKNSATISLRVQVGFRYHEKISLQRQDTCYHSNITHYTHEVGRLSPVLRAALRDPRTDNLRLMGCGTSCAAHRRQPVPVLGLFG